MSYWVLLPSSPETISFNRQMYQIRGFDLRCLLTDGGLPECRQLGVDKSSMKIINSANTSQDNNIAVCSRLLEEPQNKEMSLITILNDVLNKIQLSMLGAPGDTDQKPTTRSNHVHDKCLPSIFSLERIFSSTLNHYEATNIGYISGQCGFDCVIAVDVGCPGNQTL